MKGDITTRAGRRSLPPRREPYWQRIDRGAYLGYRVSLKGGEGTWIARWRDEDGKQHYHALPGPFETFDQARQKAEAWFRHCDKTGGADELTVAEACVHYVQHLRDANRGKTSDDAEGRFRKLVYDTDFGKISLNAIRPTRVKAWRDSISASGAAPATVNRNLNVLKAALNLAHRENLVADDSGWMSVPAIAGASKSRDRWLDAGERAALLDACPADLRAFVRGLLLTAARPGELASSTVADFNPIAGTLKYRSSKTEIRAVSLSTTALELCIDQSRGKLPGARLFSTADGKPWTKDRWTRPFRAAVLASGIADPTTVVLYAIRHTAISEMVASGMDAFTVAKMAGTSTTMIDKHYGHLVHEKTRDRLNRIDL